MKDFAKRDFNLSPEARGFHPGDDDRLQETVRKNLEKQHRTLVSTGDVKGAERVKQQLEALEKVKTLDAASDPHDKIPDDPHMG